MTIRSFILIFILGLSVNSFARGGSDGRTHRPNQKVTWIGELSDDPSTHDTKHQHKLRFTRQDNGERYDVKDSPELSQLHESGKNYLLEIDAEIHPYFFSSYLTVDRFKILKATTEEIPHVEPKTESIRPLANE